MVSGANGSEGIDLAALNAILQTRQGHLGVTSKFGQGTRFTLELPLDMAVIDGMVVRVGGVCYVVPIGAIRRIVKPEQDQVICISAGDGQSLLRLGEELVPIQSLTGAADGAGSVGGVPPLSPRHTPGMKPDEGGVIGKQGKNNFRESLMLVVEKNKRTMALTVDELIGQQQVLVRPLQGYLADVERVSGCALLGDGEVGMVLNLSRMNL